MRGSGGRAVTYKRRHLVCVACGTRSSPLLWDNDPRPPCLSCQGAQVEDGYAANAAPAVIGDECDVTIRHGLCYDDGTPRRFRSKAEFRAVAKAKGWTPGAEFGHKGGEVAKWNER